MSILIGFLYVVIFIVAVFLILLVVAQSNKGSDLGLFGGSAEMVFGSGQMHAVAKITMTSAIVLLLSVFLVGFLKSYTSRSLKSTVNHPAGVVIPDTSATQGVSSASSPTSGVKDSPQNKPVSPIELKEKGTKDQQPKPGSLTQNISAKNPS